MCSPFYILVLLLNIQVYFSSFQILLFLKIQTNNLIGKKWKGYKEYKKKSFQLSKIFILHLSEIITKSIWKLSPKRDMKLDYRGPKTLVGFLSTTLNTLTTPPTLSHNVRGTHTFVQITFIFGNVDGGENSWIIQWTINLTR